MLRSVRIDHTKAPVSVAGGVKDDLGSVFRVLLGMYLVGGGECSPPRIRVSNEAALEGGLTGYTEHPQTSVRWSSGDRLLDRHEVTFPQGAYWFHKL